MANDVMTIEEIEYYTKNIIPKIEYELGDNTKTDQELTNLYLLYRSVLQFIAPYDFVSYNKYLELDEDIKNPNKCFYGHRKNHLGEIFTSLNDMEIYDKYDLMIISCPPRVGKSTAGIRFLSWIIGRHPENTQMGTSYSDSITTSFYLGVMEIVSSEKFAEVFPNSSLVGQNAKREEIWLKRIRRYPSISFVPIGGSMTGRTEAENYMYCDDLVSGIEEALSPARLEKLWQLYGTNVRQRKKNKCKEIHICTRWSVHDVATRLENEYEGDERCKIIKLSCYDDFGESTMDFVGGFDTHYYKDLERNMDYVSFSALYKQEPIEREGLLYEKSTLKYYFELPTEKPDTIIAVCDSKNSGKDFVAMPVGYVYGEDIYIEDLVYNNGLPDVTRPLVAQKLVQNMVVRADVELNNGGEYYAEKVNELVKEYGGHTNIATFFTNTNKLVKIITYADFVKSNMYFKHPSTYEPNSEYAKFMRDLTSFTQTGKSRHDDAPDSLAMLAELFQRLSFNTIKIIDRHMYNI